MIKKTLVLLIDFEGHPSICDDEITNTLRFSWLKTLIFNDEYDNPDFDILFMSDHLPHHTKMMEYERMIGAETRHRLIKIDPDAELDLDDVIHQAQMHGYEITNVIIGGCNTIGCVLDSCGYSALKWARAGYPVQICLTMCADYQMYGQNMTESNIYSFSQLYTRIQAEYDAGTVVKIEIISNIHDIKLKV